MITWPLLCAGLQLCKLITEGKLRPTIDTVFPLSEAAAAHTKVEEGHVRGKLVLRVADISHLEDFSADASTSCILWGWSPLGTMRR
jgi:hypothetical protein